MTSPSNQTCKWCHCAGLHWRDVDGRWRLAYEGGQLHTCRATRDKLAKRLIPERVTAGSAYARISPEGSVPATEPRRHPFWDLKGLAAWEKRQPIKPEPPREPFTYMHEWFAFLDERAPEKAMKSRAAQQSTFEEMIP